MKHNAEQDARELEAGYQLVNRYLGATAQLDI